MFKKLIAGYVDTSDWHHDERGGSTSPGRAGTGSSGVSIGSSTNSLPVTRNTADSMRPSTDDVCVRCFIGPPTSGGGDAAGITDDGTDTHDEVSVVRDGCPGGC